MADSSMAMGQERMYPVNMNTARPAPKPRYTMGIVHGVFSCTVLASLLRVNMTIWKGTTMEKMHSR